ncbi:MAG: DUF6334 family protein [Ardenticatenaceae bacterium]
MVGKVNFPVSELLTGVSIVKDEALNRRSIKLNEVCLFFESMRIILRPIAETDEVEIIKEPNTSAPDKNETPEWARQFLGQMLQTVWICKNLQNYQDMVVFAFEFLHPTLAFVAECSVLRVFSFDHLAQ